MRPYHFVFAVLSLTTWAASGQAAVFDAYLKIDGIAGESIDRDHKDWIDLRSFSWGLSNASTGTVGGGSGAGRAVFSPFSYTQGLDASVPSQFLAAASGRRIEDMTLDLVRAGENRQRFFQMVFEDVSISSLHISGQTSTELPAVSASANYGKVTLRYFTQKADGGVGEVIEGGWDLARNNAFTGDPNALAGLLIAGGSINGGTIGLVSAVPEPHTYALMLAGLGLAVLWPAWKKREANSGIRL